MRRKKTFIEKKEEILKIGIFILIAIGSFLIIRISQACTVASPVTCPGPITYNCGFYRKDPDGWVCGIKMTPDSYYCSDALVAKDINECSNADVWFKQDACPETALHNGEKCVFADGSTELAGVHCYSRDGNWNAEDKACIECLDKKRSKLLADTSKRCFNLTDTTWEEYACANDFAGTCDYGCGADLECNHKMEGDSCGTGGTCDANCKCGEVPPPPPPPPPGACKTGPTYTCPAWITCPVCPEELQGGLVPCGRMCDDPCTAECECAPCTLCHLFVLFKRIIDFLAKDVLFPLAVLMIVVGGVMFLTAAGDPGKMGTAKKILTSVVIGLVIIFLAWLIVDTIIMFITKSGSPLQNWKTINCPISGFCGDGNCDPWETPVNCSADCAAPAECPNGACNVAGGECTTCPADCNVTTCCGNGICDVAVGETNANCPADCAAPAECPNGACNVAGGECTTCPADCNVTTCCGNGICDVAVGENSTNCPADCHLPGCPPCIICP